MELYDPAGSRMDIGAGSELHRVARSASAHQLGPQCTGKQPASQCRCQLTAPVPVPSWWDSANLDIRKVELPCPCGKVRKTVLQRPLDGLFVYLGARTFGYEYPAQYS